MRHLILCLSLLATSAAATEMEANTSFSLNMSPVEVIRASGARTLADLKPGDEIQGNAFYACKNDGGLAVVGSEADITNPFADLRFLRGETGFSILAQKVPDGDGIRELVRKLARTSDCSTTLKVLGVDESDLIPITDVLGETSLTSLLALADTISEEKIDTTSVVAEAWILNEDRDEITDQPNVFAMASSEIPIYSQFGVASNPTMVLRCRRNTTSLYVVFDDYEINDRMDVSWRIDDRSSQSGRWSVSSDNKAAGLWQGSQAIPFLKSLIEGETIRIRLQGRSSEHNVQYPIGPALRSHIEKIAAACNWSL